MRTQIRVARERSRIVSILVIFKIQSPCCTHGSVVIGVLPLLIFFGLSDKISDARWLTEAEKKILTSNLHKNCATSLIRCELPRPDPGRGYLHPQYRFLGPILLAAPRKNGHARHGRACSSGAPTSL
jgi:hypothetical protein